VTVKNTSIASDLPQPHFLHVMKTKKIKSKSFFVVINRHYAAKGRWLSLYWTWNIPLKSALGQTHDSIFFTCTAVTVDVRLHEVKGKPHGMHWSPWSMQNTVTDWIWEQLCMSAHARSPRCLWIPRLPSLHRHKHTSEAKHWDEPSHVNLDAAWRT